MVNDYESYVERVKNTKEWDKLESYRKLAKRRRIYAWFIGLGIVIIGVL